MIAAKVLKLSLLSLVLLLQGPGETFYDIVPRYTYVYVYDPHTDANGVVLIGHCVVVTTLENTGLAFGTWSDL
jgi:hypothetical protein